MVENNTLQKAEFDLSKSFLFRDIEKTRLNLIRLHATSKVLSTGRTLFLQDDPGDAIYLVQSGSLEVNIISGNGKKLSLNIMESGDVIGEIAALDGGPRTASVVAKQDTVLLRIERNALMKILKEDPDLALDLIQVLCHRLRWISQQVEDHVLLNIEGRLASRLIILARKFSDPTGHLNFSQSELADFLGVTRESTNKILQAWKMRGIIDISRGSINVRNHHALAEIAEPYCM